MNTSKHILLAALGAFLAVCALTPAKASLIVAWNANSANTTLTSSTASTVDPNLTGPVTLALGPGFSAHTNGSATFGGFYEHDTSGSMSNANTAGTYFEFTLTPASGYQVQISSLVVPTNYDVTQSHGLFTWQGNPACTVYLASSSDSFGSSLGSASPTGLGADAGYFTINLTTPLTISSAETFRIEISEAFAYRDVGLAPDNYWDSALRHNALEINGSLTSASPVPEPATCGALAGLALTGFSLTSFLRRGKRAAAKA